MSIMDDFKPKDTAPAPASKGAVPAPTASAPAPVSSGGGIMSDFKPGAAAAPTAAPAASTPTAPVAMPAAMTYDQSDPNASVGSKILSMIHNAAVGGNLWSRAFQDAATMGGLDKAQSMLPGAPSVDELRAQTEQSRKDIGPVGSATADLAGYAMAPGKLGVGDLITSGASRVGGQYLGRIAGAAGESALVSGVGTLGHGGSLSDAGHAATMGGLLGAATGVIPGARGSQYGKVVQSPTADLENAASQAYAPLKNQAFPTPDIEKAVSGVQVPQGLQAKMSNSLSDQIDRIQGIVAKGGQTTADDVADFRASLMGAAKTDTDRKIAGQYLDALDKQVGPSAAADIAAANKASNVAKTSGDLDNWIAMAKRSPNKVPDAVNSAITDSPNLYRNVLPQLQDVANSQPGIWSKLGGKVGGALAGAAIQGGAEYIGGQNPITGAISGGLEGLVLGHAAGQLRSSNLVAKLAAARELNKTGATLPSSAFAKGLPGFGPLIAYAPKIPAALGASGAFVPSDQR